jgi:peptidyl-prolyl cis-trans isomerase C
MRIGLASLVMLAPLACGEPPPTTPRAPRGPVVAEVDGVAIHRAELEARMRHDGLAAREALDRLIDEELTIEAARRLGLRPDRDLGLTRKRAQVQALLAREVEAKVGPADVAVADIEATWESGRQLEADHLLAKFSNDADREARTRARGLAARVGAAAKRTTTRDEFIALATSMSEAGTNLLHEDLGKFRRDGRFVRAFEDRVFQMTREGEVSEPFETDFGWHIARLRAAGNVFGESLETARADVIDKLVTQRRRALFDALVQRLERTARVEVDPAALLALDPAP